MCRFPDGVALPVAKTLGSTPLALACRAYIAEGSKSLPLKTNVCSSRSITSRPVPWASVAATS
jgi:hypothetical protein